MTPPEIPHSDHVFPRQMGVDLGLARAHGGAPVLEYLDGGAVGDALGDAAFGVGGSHDGGDGSRAAIEHVAPNVFDKLRHSIPQGVYGYCPNGTRACGILSTKIGAEIKQLACVSVGGAEFLGAPAGRKKSPHLGMFSYCSASGRPVKRRAPTHFAFSPKTPQNAKLAAPLSSASTGAASNLSRESATSSHRPIEGKADAVISTASGAVQGAEACTPPSDQGTASDERRPTSTVCGRGGVTGRRDGQPNTKIGASALKRQSGRYPSPPTPAVLAGANSPHLAPGMGGQHG